MKRELNLSSRIIYNMTGKMITFIKELFKIIWMLFSSNPREFDSLELVKMNYFPFSGSKYMSWCGHLIHKMDDIEEYMKRDVWKTDYNHELIHLFQAKDFRFWITYYASYLWQWFKYNPFSRSSYYLDIYEIEAYAKDKDLEYTKSYPNNMSLYDIKGRKKIWKDLGGTSRAWKEYIRNLYK